MFCRIVDASNYPTFLFRLDRDGLLGGFESFQSSDTLSYRYPFEEIIRKEDDNIDILVALLIGIVGSMIATYLIRFIDKRMHKNNRHESK